MKKMFALAFIGLLAVGCSKPIAQVPQETKLVTPQVLDETTSIPAPVVANSETPPPQSTNKAVKVNSPIATQAQVPEVQSKVQVPDNQKALEDAQNLLAQQKAQAEEEAKQRAKEQAAKEAADLQQQIIEKQALLAAIKSECTNPINDLKQQILDIKSKYFNDLASLDKLGGITTNDYNARATKLLNDANTKIQILTNQINKLQLQCSIKYGN